jgi:hypothetical protein
MRVPYAGGKVMRNVLVKGLIGCGVLLAGVSAVSAQECGYQQGAVYGHNGRNPIVREREQSFGRHDRRNDAGRTREYRSSRGNNHRGWSQTGDRR